LARKLRQVGEASLAPPQHGGLVHSYLILPARKENDCIMCVTSLALGEEPACSFMASHVRANPLAGVKPEEDNRL